MSLLDTLVELKGVEFDINLDLFPPPEGTTITLLQEDGTTVAYRKTDNRDPITSGWGDEIPTGLAAPDPFSQNRQIWIATTEVGFGDVLRRSTHLAVGSTIYTIDRATIAPPTQYAPYYAVNIERTTETYP